jgi:hypothetical protein
MPLPPKYTSPKDDAELERRKVLSGQLKEFAQKPDSSPNTAKGLMEEAGKVGVSRDQMSSLFQQYKAETPSATPSASPQTAMSPSASGSGSEDGGPATPRLDGGAATPRLDRGPVTPGLDRLAAMQGTPMGSTSTLNQTRSLESAEGKSLRMARKLQRMGFGGAAETVALSAAKSGMDEPNIKNQEFRGFEEKSKRAATTEAAANEELKRRQFQFQNKLLEQQNKDLASGQFDYLKYAPSK